VDLARFWPPTYRHTGSQLTDLLARQDQPTKGDPAYKKKSGKYNKAD
jgi:hypothetical protein